MAKGLVTNVVQGTVGLTVGTVEASFKITKTLTVGAVEASIDAGKAGIDASKKVATSSFNELKKVKTFVSGKGNKKISESDLFVEDITDEEDQKETDADPGLLRVNDSIIPGRYRINDSINSDIKG